MSRLLRNRKLWMLVAGLLLTAVLLVMKLWVVAIVVAIGELMLFITVFVVRETQKPIYDLHNNRKIRIIDTLIIGDWCSRRQLSKQFDLSRALIVRAPGRSEKASLLLLMHLASRLDGRNVCIVQANNDSGEIGPFDVPYLSQLTKLEMGLVNSSRKMLTYLFFHPKELAKVLVSPFYGFTGVKPNDKDLVEYCQRKGFILTCLK